MGKRLWAGILLWALKTGDAPFRWEQQKGLGALASQESSMTFKPPASSSPTVVNAEAICYDLSVLQPRPAVAATLFRWHLAGKATGRREREEVHPPFVGRAEGSSNPALPTQQGALKDIRVSHAEIPPKAPSAAFLKWQQAIFVQPEESRASLYASRQR